MQLMEDKAIRHVPGPAGACCRGFTAVLPAAHASGARLVLASSGQHRMICGAPTSLFVIHTLQASRFKGFDPCDGMAAWQASARVPCAQCSTKATFWAS